jgi:hypothetical protein
MLLGLFDKPTKSKFISATVPSNSTETEEFTVPRDSVIKHVEARFYPGQQLDLELQPRLKKKDSDTRIDLVDYPGDKNHLEGDDDKIELPTNVEAEKEDTIEVKAENQDTSGNAYDYYVIVTLERK